MSESWPEGSMSELLANWLVGGPAYRIRLLLTFIFFRSVVLVKASSVTDYMMNSATRLSAVPSRYSRACTSNASLFFRAHPLIFRGQTSLLTIQIYNVHSRCLPRLHMTTTAHLPSLIILLGDERHLWSDTGNSGSQQ